MESFNIIVKSVVISVRNTFLGRMVSLFSEKKVFDIRLSSGRPGAKGSKVLMQWCENLSNLSDLILDIPCIDYASKKVLKLVDDNIHLFSDDMDADEIKQIIHPRAIIPIRIGDHVIEPSVQRTVLSFFILYILKCNIHTLIGLVSR